MTTDPKSADAPPRDDADLHEAANLLSRYVRKKLAARTEMLSAHLAAAESERDSLRDALRGLRDLYPDDASASEFLDREGMRFYRETGIWPTFKSAPLEMHHEHDEAERTARWHEWLAVERAKAHAAARRVLGGREP